MIDEYKLTIKNKNYYLRGNFSNTFIYIVIKCGSTLDKSKYGLAHIVEHLFIHIFNKEKRSFKELEHDVHIGGVTHFDYTMFVISIPSKKSILRHTLEIIDNIFNKIDINDYDIKKVIKEVADEHYVFYSKWKREKEITHFLTKDTVRSIPIGELNIINSININDVKDFLYKNYISENLHFIFTTNMDISHHLDSLMSCNYKNNSCSISSYNSNNNECSRIVTIKNDINKCRHQIISIEDESINYNEIKLLFRIEHIKLSMRMKIIRTLFEDIISKVIQKKLEKNNNIRNIYVTDKYISSKNYFSSITIQLNKSAYNHVDIVGVLESLRKVNISECDYNNAVENVKSAIDNLCNKSDTRVNIVNNIITHIIYFEPLHINSTDYQNLQNILNTINLNEVNDYKNYIFNNECNIVMVNTGD